MSYSGTPEEIREKVNAAARRRREDPAVRQLAADATFMWRQKNRERVHAARDAWRKANPEKARATVRASLAKHKDKYRPAKLAYYAAHRGEFIARAGKRRAAQIQATPPWLTDEHHAAILKIYRDAPAGYEVDHIIPLQGKTVSGLHVPWNLQPLPMAENRAKSNKLEDAA